MGKSIKFVSLFAGVGGFDLGLERAGHTCVGQVEIDKKCLSVLENHWPDVPKHNDVVTAKEWADEIGLVGQVDLVVGGFPCQDVSVAGKRAGLAGKRTGLFFDALSFATHVKAETIILENVPGLLSSNNGRDFGVVLSSLADAGYSNIEWRVLNSQFFGVPQRRRRVFVVANLGTKRFREVLTERESSGGNYSSSNGSRETVTRSSGERSEEDHREVSTFIKTIRSGARDENGNLPPEVWAEQLVSPTLNVFDNSGEARATVLLTDVYPIQDGREMQKNQNGLGVAQTAGQPSYTLDSTGAQSIAIQSTTIGRADTSGPQGKGYGEINGPMYTVDTVGPHGVAISYDAYNQKLEQEVYRSLRTGTDSGDFVAETEPDGTWWNGGQTSQTLDAVLAKGQTMPEKNRFPAVIKNSTVRRLTPIECERLQGFPDDWTSGQADSNRYKQMGNAVTVNVIEWIGKRL
jgi:DNA (cytosine-5)-methyltransferase 1